MVEHFYNTIQGWFTQEKFYKEVVESLPNDAKIVEIGAWRGKSTSFLIVECINSGKNINIDVVDTWEGSNEDVHKNDPAIINGTLFDEFINNLKSVEGHFNPIRAKSTDAASLFEDESLDFVYIDASHEYQDVKEDILAWYPKVKPGGIISGDDFEWDGVRKAVQELFPEIAYPTNHFNTWYKTK